jgi:hypothetical protein
VKSKELAIPVVAALLGAAIAMLLRPGSGTTGPSADGDEVASLRQRVAELEHRLAERGPPPPLAAAPTRRPAPAQDAPAPVASSNPPIADAPAAAADSEALVKLRLTGPTRQFTKQADGTYAATTSTGAEAPPVRFGWGERDVAYPVESYDADPRPTAAELPSLLESRDRKDVDRALREIARGHLRDFLPTLTDLVNRPERREDASRLIDVIAQLKDRRWSALQATGAPDTPIAGDLGTAWASKGEDMGLVTLDLDYDRAVRVDGVRIHETLNAGAIAKVQAKAANGMWETIWEGEARREPSPTWFEPIVRPTTFSTNTIRLVVDTNHVPGWNEIDAVELVGDGLRQWASKATASSSYSDP